ncbi:MAG: hypothetical protein Q4G70_01400 [Pseudomonadota bacterium]|nr:hypothetical protein [Pseudomonadota bacterium]
MLLAAAKHLDSEHVGNRGASAGLFYALGEAIEELIDPAALVQFAARHIQRYEQCRAELYEQIKRDNARFIEELGKTESVKTEPVPA